MQPPQVLIQSVAEEYAALYSNRFLVLDTNLLTAYLAEEISPHFSHKHKRLDDYSPSNRLFLKSIVTAFGSRLLTLPHILAENGNLIDPDKKLSGGFRRPFIQASLLLAEKLDEQHLPFRSIVQHPLYVELGTTDAAIASLAQQDPNRLVILSADRELVKQLSALGLEIVYFPDIRVWD